MAWRWNETTPGAGWSFALKNLHLIELCFQKEREAMEKRRLAFMNAKCIQEELKQQMCEHKERERQEKLNPFPVGCCVKGEIFPVDNKESEQEKRARYTRYAQELLVMIYF